jgi:hypothetical protein
VSQAEGGAGPHGVTANTTESATQATADSTTEATGERPTEATAERPAANSIADPPEPRDSLGAVVDWEQLSDWVRRRRVVLGGIGLIVAQIVWKAYFLSQFFFWQDDYHYLDRALDNGLTWKFLTQVDGGHLSPGLNVVSWVLARVALYDWALASFVSLALLAGAALAALRLLRLLFGDRPVILIPLVVYLLTPLTLPDLGWWSSAIESLPLQLATFMALAAQVHYVRTGRFKHAVAACAWIAVGLLFFEKAVVLPLLLFAVTSAFLVPGPWPHAARDCLVRYWRAWLLYAGLLAAYAAVFIIALNTSTSTRPGSPGPYRGALAFIFGLVRYTFVPGALGGPWRWASLQSFAYSAPPVALEWLSWIVAACVITVSILIRTRAWRAWVIVAGWLVLADMIPVLLGRTRFFGAVLGLDTRYVADAAPVLAICVGLAFLPVAGQQETRERPRAAGANQLATAVTAAVLGAFVLSSLVSTQAYQSATTSAPARAYIANARAALAQAPSGTVIVDFPVPPALMTAALFGQYGFASKVVGDMARGDNQVRWTTRPVGTINQLMALGTDGRLRPVIWYGAVTRPPPAGGCLKAQGKKALANTVTAQLYATAVNARTVRIDYLAASAGVVTVTFGGQSQQVAIKAGLNSTYVSVHGSSNAVVIAGPGRKQLCVGGAAAGVVLPSNTGPAIPAFPAAG